MCYFANWSPSHKQTVEHPIDETYHKLKPRWTCDSRRPSKHWKVKQTIHCCHSTVVSVIRFFFRLIKANVRKVNVENHT